MHHIIDYVSHQPRACFANGLPARHGLVIAALVGFGRWTRWSPAGLAIGVVQRLFIGLPARIACWRPDMAGNGMEDGLARSHMQGRRLILHGRRGRLCAPDLGLGQTSDREHCVFLLCRSGSVACGSLAPIRLAQDAAARQSHRAGWRPSHARHNNPPPPHLFLSVYVARC